MGAFFYAHILSGIDFFFAKKSSKCHRDEKQVIFLESIWNTHFSDKMGRLPQTVQENRAPILSSHPGTCYLCKEKRRYYPRIEGIGDREEVQGHPPFLGNTNTFKGSSRLLEYPSIQTEVAETTYPTWCWEWISRSRH